MAEDDPIDMKKMINQMQALIAAEAAGRLVGRVQAAQMGALMEAGISSEDAKEMTLSTTGQITQMIEIVVPAVIRAAPYLLKTMYEIFPDLKRSES